MTSASAPSTNPIKTALILAAGFGTRMQDLTTHTPKPLLPVWGKPLLDHILLALHAYGIQRILINTHYLAQHIVTHITPWKERFAHLVIYHESTLLGGGGTLMHAAQHHHEPFFVINGDILWKERGVSIFKPLEAAWQKHNTPLLGLIPLQQAWGYTGNGDFDLAEDTALVIPKQRTMSEAAYVFSGLSVMDSQTLQWERLCIPKRRPLNAKAVWQPLIHHNLLRGCVLPNPWYHVGTKEAFEKIGHV